MSWACVENDEHKRNACFVKTVVLIMVLFIGFACSHTQPRASFNSIQFLDNELKQSVRVDGVVVSASETGNLKLNLMLRNTSQTPVSFELSTSWYDTNLKQTEEPDGWSKVTLDKSRIHILRDLTVKKQSNYYLVQLRKAQSN